MPKRVFDTSRLINHWKRYPKQLEKTDAEAEKWGMELIRIENTDAIVTPVELEMLGGDENERDRQLTRAYLKPFRVIDKGRILKEDWDEARRLIVRIPNRPKPRARGLVDCLIRAIATRLNHEVLSDDKGMPSS
jgi:predicted nucleic acid-binding protein